MKFYEFLAKNINGEECWMSEYNDKVVLIVNIAVSEG